MDIGSEWERVTGLVPELALGERWVETVHPDDRLEVYATLEAARRAERAFRFIARIKRADSQYRWVMGCGAPRRDADGAFRGHEGALIEYDDRMSVEREIADIPLSSRYRTALQSLGEAVFLADAEGRIIDFNEEFVRYHRFRNRAETSRSFTDCVRYFDVWHGDGQAAPSDEWALPRALRGEAAENVEYRLIRRETGEIWWGSYNFSPIKDPSGKIVGAVVAAREISEQKAAEEKLRDSEALLRAVVDGTPDAIFVKDRQGRLLLANPPTLAAIGKPAALCIGKTDAEFLLNAEDAREIMAHDRRVMEAGETLSVIETLLTPGGSRCFRNSKAPLRNAAGEVIGLIGIAQDITEIRLAEAARRESEERFRAVVEGAPIGIATLDEDGALLSINPALAASFDYDADELVGQKVEILDLSAPGEEGSKALAQSFRECLLRGRPSGGEIRARKKDGSCVPVEASFFDARVNPLKSYVCFLRDLTAQRAAEQKADNLQTERLSAIGGLAIALSHEINQPFLASIAHLAAAQRRLKSESDLELSDVHESLKLAVEQTMRAAEIIRHLREFAKSGEPDKLFHSLHAEIVGAVQENFHTLSAANIEVVLRLDAVRDHVLIDRVQMTRVLANLIKNAREAMSGFSERRLTISTSLPDDGHIRVDVSDSGAGVPETMKQSLFEPFATAKETGIGIGLSISRTIVAAHYGELWLASTSDKGSTFSFTLPLE